MPMIPSYNGGVPSVNQTVAGFGGFNVNTPNVQSAPMQRVSGQVSNDYEKMFQTACKTFDDGINSMAKALEVADARYIKAQSDEIETQAMDAINSTLYDEKTGYFTKQGKNAIDSYKETSDALLKNVNGLLDNADPRVREAVQTRVNQRIASAGTSMQRWYASQSNQYNITTSTSRIETLINDAAQNYGNSNYWGKTIASIKQEVGYLGKLHGWSEETLSIKEKQALNNAVILKYRTFGADNSMNAWVAYQGEKKNLDVATRERIESSLKAKYIHDNYSLLKGTEAARTMDPDKKVELAGWDGLDRLSKKQMLSYAHSEMVQENQVAKTEAAKELRNRVSEAGATGYVEPYSPNDFSMFGDKAEEACKKANAQLRFASATYHIKGMALTDAIEFAEGFKPASGSQNYAEEYKYYEDLKKIISSTWAEYKKDGIGTALKTGMFGYKQLTGDVHQDKDELRYRVSSAIEFQKQNGLEHPVVFSNAELDGLIGVLAKQETFTKQAAILRDYADALGDQGIQILSSQLKPKNSVYAIAMAKINDATEGENGASVGTKILEGNYYLNTKKDVSLEKGIKKDFLEVFGAVDDPSAVYSSQQALDSEIEAAKCVYAYETARGKSVDAEEAVQKVVGNIEAVNGKRVILSEGMDGGDTLDYVKSYIGAITTRIGIVGVSRKQMSFTNEEVMENIQNIQLETYDKANGKASYMVRTNAGYLANRDGTPMIIEVPTLEQIKVNVKVSEDKGITDSFDYGYGTDNN